MKIDANTVLRFMEFSGCNNEYTAVHFLKKFRSLDDAVSSYYDQGCPEIEEPFGYTSIFDDSKVSHPNEEISTEEVTSNNGNENIIRKAFEEVAIEGLVNSENIEVFCNKLGINGESGYELYLLGFIGGCELYQHFENKHIKLIEKALKGKTDVKEFLRQEFESLKGDKYYQFLKVVYRWLVILINEANKGVKKGMETNSMLDFLADVLRDVIQPKLQGDVFEQLINYIINVDPETRKKKQIPMDTFAYLPFFLTSFKDINSLKMSQNEIDNLCSLPTLYSDFLTFMNKENNQQVK
ncbi:hypothetical protein ENUP19_0088G0029 [Entamoeba nuttalli]|uniref:Uncharacterized protein n=2 Tax=Entamoeba nuttalli TaxID=412467 RepID=K2H477_ENTNP|nr:hypothetical protein ENU1_203380 [Entamoeba nuttalli P19]EKE37264.1 hypothetical protein ENU1_203380 [Entamoeba nuttalli P19]|eukprot:XP_008860401.1 hypothetical protein ENU1_203380 [Entamoeba nuttalli P19]